MDVYILRYGVFKVLLNYCLFVPIGLNQSLKFKQLKIQSGGIGM